MFQKCVVNTDVASKSRVQIHMSWVSGGVTWGLSAVPGLADLTVSLRHLLPIHLENLGVDGKIILK